MAKVLIRLFWNFKIIKISLKKFNYQSLKSSYSVSWFHKALFIVILETENPYDGVHNFYWLRMKIFDVFFIFLKFENILSSTFGCRPVFQLCYRQKSIILAFWSKITKEICNLLISGVLLSQSIGIKTCIRQSPTCLEWYQVYLASLGYFRWPPIAEK